MKTSLLILLFLLFGSLQVSAQNFQWVRVDSGYNVSYSSTYTDELILDENGVIYKFSQLDSRSDYDSSTSSNISYIKPTLVTATNSTGKIIKRYLIPGKVQSVVMDKKGNLYCTGTFENKYDFDHTKGSSILNSDGGTDVFILKYNSSGKLILALRIGGASSDNGYNIEIDKNFNIISSGIYYGLVDFDPGAATYKISSSGNYKLKLDSLGNFISVNSHQMYSDTWIKDSKGNQYNIGTYSGTYDFDPDNSKTFYLTAAGNYDGFIQKLDNNGNLIWAKSIGGRGDDVLYSIAIDRWQNVYSTGIYNDSIDLDPSSKKYYLESKGKFDVFMSKLDSMGSFVWGLRLGGAGTDIGDIVSIDDSNNVYFCGSYQDSVDFDPGGNHYKLFGNSYPYSDIYILKLNSIGKFLWAKTLVSKNIKTFTRIVIDKQFNIYLGGAFKETLDFNPDAAKYEKIGSSYYQYPFLLKLGPCPS